MMRQTLSWFRPPPVSKSLTTDTINITGTPPKYIFEVSSVREQAAISGDNRSLIDRRDIVPRCQRYDERAVDFDKIVWHAKKTEPVQEI